MSDHFCPDCDLTLDFHDGPDSCEEAEAKAERLARRLGMTYLDPATELDRARHENANLNGLLTLRSAALNRTGTQNDHLRATVAACPSCRTSILKENQ